MWQERAKKAMRHASALLRDWSELVAQRFGRPMPPLTRTEIIWAYRSILDREPVNDAEIDARRNDCASVPQLRRHMVSSDSYRANNPPLHLPALMGDEPPMVLEAVNDSQELQTLLTHVQSAWQFLGETEPYWSVVT